MEPSPVQPLGWPSSCQSPRVSVWSVCCRRSLPSACNVPPGLRHLPRLSRLVGTRPSRGWMGDGRFRSAETGRVGHAASSGGSSGAPFGRDDRALNSAIFGGTRIGSPIQVRRPLPSVLASAKGRSSATSLISRRKELVQRQQRHATNGGKLSNTYDLSGLLHKLQEFESEFREVEEANKARRKAVAKRGYQKPSVAVAGQA